MAEALPDDPAALLDPAAGSALATRPVDTARLRRLAEAGRRVEALRDALSTGPTGLGRARLGLVVARDDETAWMAAFPDDPFAVPVQVVPAVAAADVARGLARAMADEALDDARLLRWARVVLDRPAEADQTATRLRALAWEDLDADERAAATPVVLVGTAASLEGPALPGLARVLAGALPVKVLALDRLADGGVGPVALLAMARDRATVAQVSVGAPAGFVDGVALALVHDGPAAVRVHAPSPSRDGFPASDALAVAEAAARSRAFPTFRYDPTAPGAFGSRISLGEVEGAEGDTPTWRVLQELAGVVTPFTARVRDEAEREARARADAEIAAVRAEAAAEVAAARAEVEAELAVRVRRRLMGMAGYGGADV